MGDAAKGTPRNLLTRFGELDTDVWTPMTTPESIVAEGVSCLAKLKPRGAASVLRADARRMIECKSILVENGTMYSFSSALIDPSYLKHVAALGWVEEGFRRSM